ncbi:hypothetical protein P4361_03335 [Fictibacillus sp. B-59209]|uniref:hypothetical protein n=1 Tax=Fictibacillus sp. B-59209 TaxID=3024873 RepID=UPI002E1F319F|nr:hypothetical protein [Fictibacillus sp. B-59209]
MEKKYSIMTLILLWSGLVIVSSMYVTIPLTTVFTGTFHITANQAAFIDQFSGLVMLRALERLIAAAFALISFVYAAEMFPPEKRLTAVGLY